MPYRKVDKFSSDALGYLLPKGCDVLRMREYDFPEALVVLIGKDEQAAREVFLVIDVIQH